MPRRRALLAGVVALVMACAPLAVRSSAARETAASTFVDAKDQFTRGRYAQAIVQLRDMLDQWPGSAEAEDATWYLAESYRLTHDWTLAQVQYEHLIASFPGSARRADATYYLGDALWHQAHGAAYDQDFTERARAQFQRFLEMYPDHEKVTEARVAMQAATDRLAERSYRECKTYYALRDLDALQLYVRDLNERYPHDIWAERGTLLVAKALERNKRLGEALTTYTALADSTRDATLAAEAKRRAADISRRLGSTPSARAQ